MRDKNTLGLDDDLDFCEMAQALEKAFGAKFAPVLPWFTVGDVFDELLAQAPTSDQPGKCATSMAFYRLRQALLTELEVESAIGPRTRLCDVNPGSAKALHKRLSIALGLELPAVGLSPLGTAGWLLLLAGFLGGLCATAVHGFWPCAALFPVGLVMMRLDPGTFGTQTIGDLARRVATKNFHAFAKAGADRRPGAIWATLVELLDEFAEHAPSEITRDTRLHA
jgi:hypothetical protein